MLLLHYTWMVYSTHTAAAQTEELPGRERRFWLYYARVYVYILYIYTVMSNQQGRKPGRLLCCVRNIEYHAELTTQNGERTENAILYRILYVGMM